MNNISCCNIDECQHYTLCRHLSRSWKKHSVRQLSHIVCIRGALLLVAMVLLSDGCTHKYNPEEVDQRLVTFRVSDLNQIPFGQRDKMMQDFFTRISFALFKDGEKVKSIHQQTSDESFGSWSLSIDSGTYVIVVIAHNGLGNATISSPERVTFYKNKCTDTFCAVDTLRVVPGECYDIVMRRIVAMLRTIIQDDMPSEVQRMKFYYTGGSSTLNPSTGFGCVNSRQTELFDIDETMVGHPSQFEVYTFPHQYNDTLSVRISALDGNDSVCCERQLTSVPVTTNMVTQYTTTFFGATSAAVTLSLFNGGSWDGIRVYK